MKKGERPHVPDRHPEQAHREAVKSPEHQPQPSAWDVLEENRARLKMLTERYLATAHRRPNDSPGRRILDGFIREGRAKTRLKKEIDAKGTARDKLVIDLLSKIEPGFLSLAREEFQQLRLQVDSLSEEEIGEEIRKRKEEIEANWQAAGQHLSFHPGVGLGEIIFKYQKGK